MSVAAKGLGPGSRSGPGVREVAKRNTADTAPRFFTAAELMPPGTGVVLPQLAGIRPELQWVSDDRSLVTLAKRLLELGIAVPEDWPKCGKNPSKYLMATVRRWIERYGASQIRRRFDLHVNVSDTILAYPDRDAVDGKLFLIVDAESAGYVVLKPCFELLETVDRQLPATLFHCLVGGLNRWLRAYDFCCREQKSYFVANPVMWRSGTGVTAGIAFRRPKRHITNRGLEIPQERHEPLVPRPLPHRSCRSGFALRDGLGFGFQIHCGINVSGVDGNVAEPVAYGVDVQTATEEVGRSGVSTISVPI